MHTNESPLLQHDPAGHGAPPADEDPAGQYLALGITAHDTGAAFAPPQYEPAGHGTPPAAVLPAGQYAPAAHAQAPEQTAAVSPGAPP